MVFSFFTIWCNSQHSFSWTQVVFSIPVSFCEVPNIDIWPVEIDFEPRSKVALLGGTHSSLERCLSRRKLQVKGWLSSCSIPDLGRIVDPMNASFFFVTWKKEIYECVGRNCDVWIQNRKWISFVISKTLRALARFFPWPALRIVMLPWGENSHADTCSWHVSAEHWASHLLENPEIGMVKQC